MCMGSASGRSELDEVARDLATGEITRRTALVRLLGAGVGVAIAGVPGASAFSRKRCPGSRKCGSKCCPKHSKCKRGKCKCDGGYSKCGKKCIDLQTSPTNCGSCGNACESGESCSAGTCQCSHTLCGPDDLCTDLNSDPSNCGFCGRACASSETCQSGECVTPCTSEGDCASSQDGHHCMTEYGICGCRPGQGIHRLPTHPDLRLVR